MFKINPILFKYIKKIFSFLIKNLIFKCIFYYNEDLTFIIKEMFNDKDIQENISNSSSDNESEIIELETEEHKESMKPINFDNFNNLTQKEKNNYIYQKMYNKAIEPNQGLIDWLINSTINNTNGNKSDIDAYIDSNLNIIQKGERESQLMSHAFERTRPYPIKKIDPSPYAFPAYMPMKKGMDDWEYQEFIDAMNETKNIKEYMGSPSFDTLDNNNSNLNKNSISDSLNNDFNNEESKEINNNPR
jgi:hypothetical protein